MVVVHQPADGGEPQSLAVPGDSDSRLALALRRHAPDALAEVYRRHGSAVIGRARSQCGVAAAQDIGEDVFLALWRHPSDFEPCRGSLRAYLLILTDRRVIELCRAEQGHRRRQDGRYRKTKPQPSLGGRAVEADQAARMRTWIEDLPCDERLAIDLAYFGHHSYREVAQLVGNPEAIIKGHIRVGLQRLRSASELAVDVPTDAGAGGLWSRGAIEHWKK